MTEPSITTYPEAKARLAEIVSRLQSGGVDLHEALPLHDEAGKLKKICDDFIDGATQELAAAGVKA